MTALARPRLALSVRQPWAWLIAAGYKDIENRPWQIGRPERHGPYSTYDRANFTVEIPERIYIHASKTFDTAGLAWLTGNEGDRPFDFALEYDFPDAYDVLMNQETTWYPRGAVIGEVDIVDCVTESLSPWFFGKYGFVLKNAVRYPEAVPCRGALGFFNPMKTDPNFAMAMARAKLN